MSDLHPATLGRSIRAVAMLALPAREQVRWLSSLGLGEPGFADEIAEEIGEAALHAHQFVELGWMSDAAAAAIKQLDGRLSAKSGAEHEDFWRVESLATSQEWVELRTLATNALAMI